MKVKHDKLEQYDFAIGEYIETVKAKYAPGIGLFLIRFSSLEHTLGVALADFLFDRSHDVGYMVIEGNSLNNKIELFRKVFHMQTKHMHPKRVSKLATLVKRLHEVRVFRNYLVHANWITLENSGYVRTRIDEKDGEVIFRKVRITPKVINSWIRRVIQLDEQLYDFTESAYNA